VLDQHLQLGGVGAAWCDVGLYAELGGGNPCVRPECALLGGQRRRLGDRRRRGRFSVALDAAGPVDDHRCDHHDRRSFVDHHADVADHRERRRPVWVADDDVRADYTVKAAQDCGTSQSLPVTVASTGLVPSATKTTTGTSGTSLPTSGADPAGPLQVALVTMMTGVDLALVTRRRRLSFFRQLRRLSALG
jgi:hypothetical protein